MSKIIKTGLLIFLYDLHRAREKAEQEFALEIQARRYLSLFSEKLRSRSHGYLDSIFHRCYCHVAQRFLHS
jgi:DNA mismatch repair ATPase MutS